MASGTLYTYPENFRAYKALIAAKYSGAKIQIAPKFVFGETNKTAAFLAKFPLGKVPAFETSDGQYITDSNAIAYYVANDQLRGKSQVEKAQVLQWMNFAETEIWPLSCTWVFPELGIMKGDKESTEKAIESLKQVLSALESYLQSRTYLVGERVTLADIVLACTMLNMCTTVCDPEFRKPYQCVTRWFNTIVNQPEFKAVAGNVQLCKGKGAAKTPNKDKPAKQPATPKEKPAPEVEEMDETEQILAAEGSSKNPFDALPKGTFIMDEFKKVYSNEEESKSIAYFWEKFDKENYSIWIGEYKYPQELTKVFMSCNLITGMFQRLDKMRKQAFASVCLFGEDNNSTISGIWVWRGQDLAFTLSPDWQIDYESYDWKKLDPNSGETKKLVEQYLSWTGTDKQGRKFNQGKIFK